MPKDKSIKKVMVIGSGPIVIGQAAEFDYAGAQACTILKREGINVVLVNSNPATIMTDKHLADEIYLEPLNKETIARILEKERPDGLLAGLGGQTGLTLAMQLSRDGTLDRLGVRLLGTDVDAIDRAEDREMFRDTMQSIGQPCVPSEIAENLPDAVAAAERIGYPVIIRPAFTLGGTGGGIAETEEEFRIIAKNGLDMSPITQILVEKCIAGWKEIEFETMRDATGEAVIVCSMENVDPVGVHTGDSIVVAPAVTLTPEEYTMLSQAALQMVEAIGVIGGCNVQFALKQDGSEYAVIEMNPRVSRSSALASKATAYPIAKITTMLALGYHLSEIRNEETGFSLSGFEPAVDYMVLKFPKFPFDKFAGSSRRLGTQMKATGEVMSIAPTFEEALVKAVRGAEIGADTLNMPPLDDQDVLERLADQDDRRLFTIYEAIKKGVSIEKIFEITKITPWFLEKIRNIAENEAYYYSTRQDMKFKIVRTCEKVFGTDQPYFYSCSLSDSEDECEARSFRRSGKPVVVVLGSGPIRIGQGIEFDYSSVHCVWMLREMGYDVVTVNNNPETVSTDYDTADRLYFEPLTPAYVGPILQVEQPVGVVVAFGGQTAIKLTKFLDEQGVQILGTSAEGIDIAEDRARFDELLGRFHIRRPRGKGVETLEEALAWANEVGYPVLLRPSYVIGGQNMTISYDDARTEAYMKTILAGGIANPVLIDKYMPGTELEVDVISDGEDVLIPGIMEHIERAGVHSGDSIAVYPPYNLTDRFLQKICDCSEKLALALGTKGLVNIQYLIFEDELYVIEVNPRASRTVPYISKVTGVPMVDIATHVMLGGKLRDLPYGSGLYRTPPYCAVKVPVFSFEKLNDANSILGPEMKSTGEVLGLGKTMAEALYKGLTSAGFTMPRHGESGKKGVLLSVETNDYQEILSVAKRFYDLGLKLYATTGTAEAIRTLSIDVESVPNAVESDDLLRLLESGELNYIIYTGAVKDETMGDFIAIHRRAMQLGIPCLTSLDTANALAEIFAANYNAGNTELVDITRMRSWKLRIPFTKMHSCGNDYIFIENFNGEITCPESLCVYLCKQHYGIGADGIVLIGHSQTADASMRSFNRDGSEGRMAGNNVRLVGKYLYDHGYVRSERMTIETKSGICLLHLFTRDGKVSSVSVRMKPAEVLKTDEGQEILTYPVQAGGRNFLVNGISVGNTHCVIFEDNIDSINVPELGPELEHHPLFAGGANVEFVRVVNRNTLRLRVWERGNGETLACGTGALAACAAAVRLGLSDPDSEILVKLPGGDVTLRCTENSLTLTGATEEVYSGYFEY